jgi:hypothetical protein
MARQNHHPVRIDHLDRGIVVVVVERGSELDSMDFVQELELRVAFFPSHSTPERVLTRPA